MANAEQINKFAEANFELLCDDDEILQAEISEEISAEEVVQVQQIILEAEAKDKQENNEMSEVFDGPLKKSRHVHCSEEKLDEYADASISNRTKKQTKWAVNVLRGNSHNLQSNFFHKQQIKAL